MASWSTDRQSRSLSRTSVILGGQFQDRSSITPKYPGMPVTDTGFMCPELCYFTVESTAEGRNVESHSPAKAFAECVPSQVSDT